MIEKNKLSGLKYLIIAGTILAFLGLLSSSETCAQWSSFNGRYSYPGSFYGGYTGYDYPYGGYGGYSIPYGYAGYPRYGYPGSFYGGYPRYGYPYGGYGGYSIPYGYAGYPRYGYPGSFYGGYTGYDYPGISYSGYSMYASPSGILIPHEIFKLLASSNYDTAQLGTALFQAAIMGAWTPWLSPSQTFYKYGGPIYGSYF